MSALVDKWSRTGLLRKVPEGPSAEKMAQLLERVAVDILARAFQNEGKAKLTADEAFDESSLANILLPLARRVFGPKEVLVQNYVPRGATGFMNVKEVRQLDYDLVDEELPALDLGITYSPELVKDLSVFCGLTAEVELLDMMADNIMGRLEDRGKLLIGKRPFIIFSYVDEKFAFQMRKKILLQVKFECQVVENG